MIHVTAKEKKSILTSSDSSQCPNCWGVTEYDDRSCDKNTLGKAPENGNLGWIQDYVKSKL